jgi:hypothetical protein
MPGCAYVRQLRSRHSFFVVLSQYTVVYFTRENRKFQIKLCISRLDRTPQRIHLDVDVVQTAGGVHGSLFGVVGRISHGA